MIHQIESRIPASGLDRFFDTGIALLALQTVLCHALVFAGHDLKELSELSLAAVSAFIGLVTVRTISRWYRIDPRIFRRVLPRTRQAAGLVILATTCVIAVVCLHRPDIVDAFHLNLAVSAIEAPEAPLVARDGLHGRDGAPLLFPVLRVQSIELTAAVIALWLDVTAIDVMHLIFPLVFAFLVPLAQGQALRRFAPGRVGPGVVLWTMLLWLVGDGSTGIADYGFIRLHQGLAVLLCVAVPLQLAAGFDLGRDASIRGAVRVALLLIVGIGLDATGLWLGPATTAMAAFAGWRESPIRDRPRWPRRGLYALIASAYPIGLLYRLHSQTPFVLHPSPSIDALATPIESAAQMTFSAALMGVWQEGLGTHALGVLLAGVVAGVAIAGPPSALQRMARFSLAVAIPAGILTALFASSPLTESLRPMIVSPGPFWSALWLVPIPFLAAAGIASVLQSVWPDRRAYFGVLIATPLLLALANPVGISASNGVQWAPAQHRIPVESYEIARFVARLATDDDVVLVPGVLAPWLSALRRAPDALVLHPNLLTLLADQLEEEEIERRLSLFRIVSGEVRPADAGIRLSHGIHADQLQVVVLIGEALDWEEVRWALDRSALEPVISETRYEIWSRPR